MSKAERARISRVLELFARFVPVEFHGMLEEEGKICVWVTTSEWTEAIAILAAAGLGPCGRPLRSGVS